MPVYGAGRSMQDMFESGQGLPLMIRVRSRSSYRVVWNLIRLRYLHHEECLLVLDGTYDQRHWVHVHNSTCFSSTYHKWQHMNIHAQYFVHLSVHRSIGIFSRVVVIWLGIEMSIEMQCSLFMISSKLELQKNKLHNEITLTHAKLKYISEQEHYNEANRTNKILQSAMKDFRGKFLQQRATTRAM